jgi:hypothetical protein
VPNTNKQVFILPAGQEKHEIEHIIIKYKNSIIEFDANTNLITKGCVSADKINLNTELEDLPTKKGTFYWNEQDGVPTINLDYGVKQSVGKELYVDGLNKTGSTITNGSVVYISGASGNRPTIDLADADDYNDSQKTIGIATHDIENNVNGYVTTFGLVRDLDTSDYSEGDILYLSQTAGSYTTVTPDDGIARIKVGMIVKSHETQGEIEVTINEDKYMFGDVDAGNYSYFESDGTLVHKGDATIWDDVNGSALQVKVLGTGVSINNTENTLDFTATADLNDYGYDNYQTPHSKKLESDIYPHIHWVQKEDNTPNWLLQYRFQSNGTATETTWTNYVCNTNAFAYTTGTINQISYGDGIAGNGLSSVIQMRVLRDTNNDSTEFSTTDSYSQTANITFIDIHVEKDTEGSRQQYIK